MKILVINPGSSSIKFNLYVSTPPIPPTSIAQGIVERIGVDGFFKLFYQNKKYEHSVKVEDHLTAARTILQQLQQLQIIKEKEEIAGIGFRIVHGGSKMKKPTIINEETKQVIQKISPLAPLHNPSALITIGAFENYLPTTPMVACFDTSFHHTIPELNYLYPVPFEWYKKYEVRKYGFHGLSYEFIVQKMTKILSKPLESLNLIICHLGNGSSICAVRNGKSIDTTMGLTPLDGLMMGTRSGAIDPSIVSYMMQKLNTGVAEIMGYLNKNSGLIGVSELSSDMRDIETNLSKKPQALVAFKKYSQTAANFIVNFANKLSGKIDAIVFTAGIGENSFRIRQEIVNNLPLLNLEIDNLKNTTEYLDYQLISTTNSQFAIFAVRTNEELLIAKKITEHL